MCKTVLSAILNIVNILLHHEILRILSLWLRYRFFEYFCYTLFFKIEFVVIIDASEFRLFSIQIRKIKKKFSKIIYVLFLFAYRNTSSINLTHSVHKWELMIIGQVFHKLFHTFQTGIKMVGSICIYLCVNQILPFF